MRIVIQRVKLAKVSTQGTEIASIDKGLVLLCGFSQEDTLDLPQTTTWQKMLGKIPELRIFPDYEDKSNLNLRQIQGEILAVSQFTLFADCRKGKRPSFSSAAAADVAESLYTSLIYELESIYPGGIKCGKFGAEMDLFLCNWGPVTIILDSLDF